MFIPILITVAAVAYLAIGWILGMSAIALMSAGTLITRPVRSIGLWREIAVMAVMMTCWPIILLIILIGEAALRLSSEH